MLARTQSMDRLLGLVLLLGLACPALSAKIPSGWKTCKRGPEMNKCLQTAVTEVVKKLMDGYPKLGVLPLDPLKLQQIELEGRGQVAVNLTFRDINIRNFKSFLLHDIKIDWDKHDILANISTAQPVLVDGDYEINGKVLLLPIVGKGPFSVVFENPKTFLHLWGSEMTKNGKKHLDIRKSTLTIDVTKMKIRLENLFNGDKRLGEGMNKFLNENWKLILDELLEPIVSAIGEAFKQISNQVFHRITLNELVA